MPEGNSTLLWTVPRQIMHLKPPEAIDKMRGTCKEERETNMKGKQKKVKDTCQH
jgi:hypothetical protein